MKIYRSLNIPELINIVVLQLKYIWMLRIYNKIQIK